MELLFFCEFGLDKLNIDLKGSKLKFLWNFFLYII